MALYIVGQEFNKLEANYLLTLGYARTDALGDKEVRMDDDGTYFYLKVKDGTEKKVGLEPNEIVTRLNAATSGPALSPLLDNFWRDSVSNRNQNPYMQSGYRVVASAGTAITFDNSYDNAPRVVIGIEGGNVCKTVSFGSLGVGGFTAHTYFCSAATTTVPINWISIGDMA